MITVLRLGHRQKRDERISTHCGLVARALGADNIVYSGEVDGSLLASIKSVSDRWGSGFRASYEANWRKFISSFDGTKVHLTMYGKPYKSRMSKIRNEKNILVIIGGEKVPGELYQLADYNVAVTNQPHSEVAALALFLEKFKLKPNADKPQVRIIPQEKGKKVVENE